MILILRKDDSLRELCNEGLKSIRCIPLCLHSVFVGRVFDYVVVRILIEEPLEPNLE